ncbi:MAG: PaaI family thioesterase [Actinobacteria bacterium]|nr:PaaI family thioesterase [Actinomycetota bacterium]MCL5886487.1 PaaI family thioesterase [Actinomycetota bacterium]
MNHELIRNELIAMAKNMDKWLGNGGMKLIEVLGSTFERYGVDGEQLGWVEGSWVPSSMACNPHGIVQAGVHGVVLDAAMNFAANAALVSPDRTKATVDMKTETMYPAKEGEHLVFRGEVVQMTRQVAFTEAEIRNHDGKLVSRATGTFLLHREPHGNIP